MLTKEKQEKYISILKEELVPATGCTEPIAIAYCAAILRKVLGKQPERIKAEVSGNILKNVKSVVVPNTNGLKGLGAAIAAGVVAGDAGKGLQVIASIPEEKVREIGEYLRQVQLEISCLETTRALDIILSAYAGENSTVVRIANSHSNVVYIEKDGKVLTELPFADSPEENLTDKSCLNVEDIVEFANTVDLGLVSELLDRQINYNTAIAEEGLNGNWGANIGSVLLSEKPNDIKTAARAYAAAGSDARMSGCELPVVIVSGSGNQGITASVPVICYAEKIGAEKETLYRALLVSNLVTIHQKTGIGRLSAYCGAVSAGCGAGAGIAYLLGGDSDVISHTVVNAIAILSGVICDGAKPSCAAKIASAIEAGILGYEMYMQGQQFLNGDGIVSDGVEKTIASVGRLASVGMRQTDRTILDIMVGQ